MPYPAKAAELWLKKNTRERLVAKKVLLILFQIALFGCESANSISLVGIWENETKVLSVEPGGMRIELSEDGKGKFEFTKTEYNWPWREFNYSIKEFEDSDNECMFFLHAPNDDWSWIGPYLFVVIEGGRITTKMHNIVWNFKRIDTK
jgi:hypothetical protein